MRTILTCLSCIAFLLCQKSEAATAPVPYASPFPFSDSAVANKPLKTVVFMPHKKMGLIRKLQLKLLQNRLKYFSRHADDGTTPKKNLLSTISLILGILGIVLALIPAGIGAIALIAAPAALVTGIIALGKRYNNNKASRTKAILGIVFGSVLIFFIIIAVIIIASGGFLLFM
jgi:hypothetical protein